MLYVHERDCMVRYTQSRLGQLYRKNQGFRNKADKYLRSGSGGESQRVLPTGLIDRWNSCE